MKDKIFIITREDKIITLAEWQQLYKLSASETQIGKYFFAEERIFARDLKDYGALYVAAPLMQVIDAFRVAVGRPLTVNAFNRNEAKQAELKAEGRRAATTSPHVVYLAIDIDTKTNKETLEFVPVLLRVAKELGINIRVGYKQYMKDGDTFIHIDVTPEYYAKGKPRHLMPHPAVWEIPYLTW